MMGDGVKGEDGDRDGTSQDLSGQWSHGGSLSTILFTLIYGDMFYNTEFLKICTLYRIYMCNIQ